MTIYKRIGSFILSLLLVFSMFGSTFAIQTFAATSPALSAESKTVNAGEQFTVAVSLANATTVYGGNFTLQYDSSLLTADSYEFSSIVSGHTKNCNLNYQSAGNLIRVTFSGASAVTSSGTLITFTFTAKENVSGSAALQFNAYKMYDENGSAITSTANGSTITISSGAVVTPSISVTSKTVTVGDTVSVPVVITNSSEVYGGNFTLQYDSTLLTADSYSFGSIISGHTKNCNLNYQSAGNLIRVTFSGADAVSSDGTLVTFTFTAKASGTATLQFNAYKMYDENGTSISTVISNGTVEVESQPTRELVSVEISSNPTKTSYEIGESLDTSGLKLKLTYSDNSTETITSGFSVSGFSSTTAGTKTVTVTYQGYADTFTVVVKSGETITGTYNGLLSYSITDGEVTITKCATTASGSLKIPDTIQGYPVKYIKSYAFVNCSSITSLTIPETVLSIGSHAFNGCTSLKNVYGAEGVRTIGEYAFQNCTALYRMNFGNDLAIIGVYAFSGCTGLATYINFGDNVQTIGGNAFYGCTSLKTVIFSDSVTSIGERAFQGCTALTGISWGNNIKTVGAFAFTSSSISRIENVDLASWCSVDFANSGSVPGGKLIFTETLNEDNLPIPEEVTTIDAYAFYIHSLDVAKKYRAMTIPSTVTTIEDGAINSSTVIYGYRDSAAEEYAEANGNKFIALDGLTKIVISSGPSKTSYYVGDSFSDSGIRLTVYCDNGLTDNSVQKGYKTSGYDMSVAGQQTVTVEYLGLTTTYTINVKEPNVSLSATSMKLNVGESAELSATSVPSGKSISWTSLNEAVATYSGGKVNAISNGTAVIRASFTYNGIEYYGECTVVVTDIDSIAVNNQPSKSVYYIGDSLDTSGLTIDLYSSDGSKKTVSSGYTVSGFNSSSAGTKTVTVSYDGLTTTFNVTVKTPSVTLSKNTLKLDKGTFETITATTNPVNQTITWVSSNTNVATVVDGKITAKNSGTTTITATFVYNGAEYSSTCQVNVRAMTGIAIHKLPNKTVFYVGDGFRCQGLELKRLYDDGSYEIQTTFNYTSHDQVAMFMSTGKSNVTVYYEGYSTTYEIEVLPISANLLTEELKLNVGDTEYIEYETDPSDISNFTQIIWKSSDTSVVTVDSNGMVRAVGSGTAKITLTVTHYGVGFTSNECVVTVGKEVNSISVEKVPSKTTYYIGDSLNTSGLELLVTYDDGSSETVTSGFTTSGFSSTAAGTKTVTVTYQGYTDTFTVTVKTPSITLSSGSKTMSVGDTSTITATTTPSGQTITWTSSNTSVATVSGGTITAKASGSTTITAKFTYNGKTYSKTCSVTVEDVPVPPTPVSLSVSSKPTKTTYEIGENLNTSGLKLKLTYSDGSTETITSGFTTSGFSSTTAGTKTVTVKYGDLTATFTVTVNEPIPVDGPRVTVESKKARVGSTVLITVSLEDNPGIWGMDLVVNYDKTQLTLTSVTNGTVFSSSEWTQGNLSGDKYILSYEASGFDNITTNGVLATLEFTVNENATVDSFASVSLSYNAGDIINVSFDDINVAIVSGGINITDFVYGDLNSDGLVNKKDSLLMKMYLADNSTTIDMQAADVYVDGSINKKDSLYLKQYLAGLDVELGA